MNFDEPSLGDLLYHKAVKQSQHLRMNNLRSQNPQLYQKLRIQEIKEKIANRQRSGFLDKCIPKRGSNKESFLLELNPSNIFKFISREYKSPIYINYHQGEFMPLMLIKGSAGDLVEVIKCPETNLSLPKKTVELSLVDNEELAEVTPIRRKKSFFKE